jgi:type I restriction enzyme R subunit
MAELPSYKENHDSQLPALRLLQKMGYINLSRQEASAERDHILSNVVLEKILEEQLAHINSFQYKGEEYKFSTRTLRAAVNGLKDITEAGLINSNRKVFEYLSLGRSFEEIIDGDKKSFTLKYIDWQNPSNNVYHIVSEYEVKGLSKDPKRLDLVLFVNGIPFVVIETKRRDRKESIDEAIRDLHNYQRGNDPIPLLFHYAQLLLAVQPSEVRYGTAGTRPEFYANWEEKSNTEEVVQLLLRSEVNGVAAENRLTTEQDIALYNLCRPQRLPELVYKFTLYDGGDKKIARYQQYFAVKNTLERIREYNPDGSRKGGLIWHTQGSGKSLTMVMLAKNIALEGYKNPRIIIVTDRTDLDKQIKETFYHCGHKNVKRAENSGKLVRYLQNEDEEIVTTVINKFEAALRRKEFQIDSPNIFVLIDESHRTQYGRFHARMRAVLPKACYLGFTGTPLMKSEKSTMQKFGGLIHEYTINKAVHDKAVVPILYEGRAAMLEVWGEKLDKEFEKDLGNLLQEEQVPYKKKYSKEDKLLKLDAVIKEIAHDVTEHFCRSYKGTGLKGQLAAPDKLTALLYHQYFKSIGKVNTKVVISPPEEPEDKDDFYEDPKELVQKFWNQTLDGFTDPEKYEEYVIDLFKQPSDDVEIIIVVHKLLTGFDAPRNAVLYLCKRLEQHNLLQAIARVNRLFEGKEFGLVVDYRGVLGELDKALTSYSALSEFYEEDLLGSVINIEDEIKKVPLLNSRLWELFKEIENKKDPEAFERFLHKDALIREDFYKRVVDFGKAIHIAYTSDKTSQLIPHKEFEKYIKDLAFFEEMKDSVQNRYFEKKDYKEYEKKLQRILDKYVAVDRVEQITEPINILNKEFRETVEQMKGSVASKADFITHSIKKEISENMDKDPAFYKKFSEMIEETIKLYIEGRINASEYLKRNIKLNNDIQKGVMDNTPKVLENKPEARALFNLLQQELETFFKTKKGLSKSIPDILAQSAMDIDAIIRDRIIVDWKNNYDVQNNIMNTIEDYLLDLKQKHNLAISLNVEITKLLDFLMQIAKNNY